MHFKANVFKSYKFLSNEKLGNENLCFILYIFHVQYIINVNNISFWYSAMDKPQNKMIKV